jgi:ABC-type dipeptide/oligopeptide/nickel transport system permease component
MSAGLLGYAIRRLLWAIPVLLAVSIIVFVILRLAPTDPVDALIPRSVYTEEQAERLREKYGYDEPIHIQYIKYMGNLFRGDPGVSIKYRDFDLVDFLGRKIWISTQLNFFALLITFAIGIPVGIYAALVRGTPMDPLVIGTWLIFDAVPTFVMAPLAMWLFALKLDIVGLSWEGVYSRNAVLPILIIALPGVAGVARLMRASIIGVIGEDFVRTARAKGLRESTVVFGHVTRNAMLPMVTVIGLSLPGITAGSLFVELVFGIPGIGRAAFDAALTPDYDVIMAIILFGSALFVLANVLVDLAYGLIDPRVRVGQGRG